LDGGVLSEAASTEPQGRTGVTYEVQATRTVKGSLAERQWKITDSFICFKTSYIFS